MSEWNHVQPEQPTPPNEQITVISKAPINDALAEWLRRVPAKYMGFPRESSNLSGVVNFFHLNLRRKLCKIYTVLLICVPHFQ
jgi:hypothetical protein